MIESPEEFRRLRESDDPAEQRRATHGEAPAAVWHALIATAPDLRSWVAHNKTVPANVLAVLAGDPDPRVRAVVAAKRRVPPDVQLALAADPDAGVRHRLVYNARATRAGGPRG